MSITTDYSTLLKESKKQALQHEKFQTFSEQADAELTAKFGPNPPESLLVIGNKIFGPHDTCEVAKDEEPITLFGENAAKQAILIANQFYDRKSSQILEKTEDNAKIVEKLDLISKFRLRLNKLRDDNPKAALITFTREEDIALIDKLSEFDECKNLFRKGEYSFENKTGVLDRRDRDLVDLAKSISTPHVNFNLMKMQEFFNERNRVMDIAMEIVKQYSEGTRVIIQNLNRR